MTSSAKNRLPPFVPLLTGTLDSAAWRATSYGARALYVALRRRVWKNRNTAFLSYRDAANEIGCSKTRVGQWYRELEHYGFIVKVRPHALGVEGKGKAALWQLTEMGTTSKTNPNGVPEPPTRDFLKWDGTKFKAQSRNRTPATHQGHSGNPARTVVSTREEHSKDDVSTGGRHSGCSKRPSIGDITSKPLSAMSNPAVDAAGAGKASADTDVDAFPALPAFLDRKVR